MTNLYPGPIQKTDIGYSCLDNKGRAHSSMEGVRDANSRELVKTQPRNRVGKIGTALSALVIAVSSLAGCDLSPHQGNPEQLRSDVVIDSLAQEIGFENFVADTGYFVAPDSFMVDISAERMTLNDSLNSSRKESVSYNLLLREVRGDIKFSGMGRSMITTKTESHGIEIPKFDTNLAVMYNQDPGMSILPSNIPEKIRDIAWESFVMGTIDKLRL
jgi:hypothetical protein